ncbi:uncharacterized protein LOC117066387 isoform X2 [Trachypithecus francoisi]|uniref:uncharacterized protein LOC117066387 isoform X2 n=1 Tax=Trachypithecus francoisi TaxID=54180 RepID=UPI00141B40B0|nr:uncharacterized protein LOC117066387 isoform X2 [Trachypithecus francoisi]
MLQKPTEVGTSLMPERTAAYRLGTSRPGQEGWAVGLAARKMLRDVPVVRQVGPCSRQNLIRMFLHLGLCPTRCGQDVPRPCGQVVGMFPGRVVRMFLGRVVRMFPALWSGGRDDPSYVDRWSGCSRAMWSGCSRPCGQVVGMFLGHVVRMFPAVWSGGQDIPGRVVRWSGRSRAVWSGGQDVPGPCGQVVRTFPGRVVRWTGCSQAVWSGGQDIPGHVVRWSGRSRAVWSGGQDVPGPCGQVDRMFPGRVVRWLGCSWAMWSGCWAGSWADRSPVECFTSAWVWKMVGGLQNGPVWINTWEPEAAVS